MATLVDRTGLLVHLDQDEIDALVALCGRVRTDTDQPLSLAAAKVYSALDPYRSTHRRRLSASYLRLDANPSEGCFVFTE